MQRIFAIVLMFVVTMISGCHKSDKVIAPVKPTDLISEQEAEAFVGGKDLVLDHNGVVDTKDNTYTAIYVTNPVGKGDSIVISVTYPSSQLSESEIKKIYADNYSKRDNKKRIRGIGSGAYVAFPSINIYEDGHLIKISAGSGDTKEQLDLLLSLGQTAVRNLDAYLKAE